MRATIDVRQPRARTMRLVRVDAPRMVRSKAHLLETLGQATMTWFTVAAMCNAFLAQAERHKLREIEEYYESIADREDEEHK
jgi:hypothetical protein